MKYKIIIFLLFTSCANNMYVNKNSFTYSSKGFAQIIDTSSLERVSDISFVSHNKLKLGSKLRIFNPNNNKSIEAIVKKKIQHDDFYKILISRDTADELELNRAFPYVEITEIKLNKSFIAEKAITENVEKKIANKAPVTKININNLSKLKKSKKTVFKTYSILVAEFYRLESAELLKKRLELILNSSNYQLIYINKKNNKSYELLMGPYNTINKLKNDYVVLSVSNFEDLDIKIND
tara:strand:- start:1303 stop:2013 length:711 start_codon:yes stop_codon:yes gene_type:complete